MRWIEKWLAPFLMASTSCITMQSLGKIVQRAPAVGEKIWCCMFFFWYDRGLRAVRSTVTYFEQVLCRGLCVHFDTLYILFQH